MLLHASKWLVPAPKKSSPPSPPSPPPSSPPSSPRSWRVSCGGVSKETYLWERHGNGMPNRYLEAARIARERELHYRAPQATSGGVGSQTSAAHRESGRWPRGRLLVWEPTPRRALPRARELSSTCSHRKNSLALSLSLADAMAGACPPSPSPSLPPPPYRRSLTGPIAPLAPPMSSHAKSSQVTSSHSREVASMHSA